LNLIRVMPAKGRTRAMHTSNFLTRLLADPARADPHRRHRLVWIALGTILSSVGYLG
jgi:hypothetical protein